MKERTIIQKDRNASAKDFFQWSKGPSREKIGEEKDIWLAEGAGEDRARGDSTGRESQPGARRIG